MRGDEISSLICVLHYADATQHRVFWTNNLALNELLLRCVSSIREHLDIEAELLILDNASPSVAHSDAISLLMEWGFKESFVWLDAENGLNTVSFATDQAVELFLESAHDVLFFLTSDTKTGPKFFSSAEKLIAPGDFFGEPNLSPYGIGRPDKYRTPEFWTKLRGREENRAENVAMYFGIHGVTFARDFWGEPAPCSTPRLGTELSRIGIFVASRRAVEKVGRLDEAVIWGPEYQYYDLAAEAGCKVYNLDGAYLCHIGGIYRSALIGSFGLNAIRYDPSEKRGKAYSRF
ncbi:MAG: hypothetical protein PHZ19_09585 [Candidatus Thermoplasmatota archaeon]|nr:hypothetical protein [Candidatus Thermoplasmatota archaeon]